MFNFNYYLTGGLNDIKVKYILKCMLQIDKLRFKAEI